MSMTRDEAIKSLQNIVEYWTYKPTEVEAAKMAIAALRPITREQVEKMRGKFFQAGIDDVAQDTWRCSHCLVQVFGNIQGINFCPACGAPMTDEAVEMVMERLEELHSETKTD